MYEPSPGIKRAAVVAGGSRCWKVVDSRGSAVCISSVVGDECKFRFCTIDGPLPHYQNMSAGNSTYILGDGRDGFYRDRPPYSPSDRPAVVGLKYVLFLEPKRSIPTHHYIYCSLVSRSWSSRCVVSFFFFLCKVPPIDSSSTEGIELDQSSLKGNINFSNIEFSYPSRPDIKVNALKTIKSCNVYISVEHNIYFAFILEDSFSYAIFIPLSSSRSIFLTYVRSVSV